MIATNQTEIANDKSKVYEFGKDMQLNGAGYQNYQLTQDQIDRGVSKSDKYKTREYSAPIEIGELEVKLDGNSNKFESMAFLFHQPSEHTIAGY